MRRISENVLDVLETWEGQNIFSVKWQKRLTLIKKAELKQKKKVRTMKICKTCVKTHRDSVTWNTRGAGLQQEKEGICKIYFLWVTVVTPDIRQSMTRKIWWEIENGILSYEKKSIHFEARIRQNYVTSQKWVEIIKPLFWQNYIKILSFWHVTPRMYRKCC